MKQILVISGKGGTGKTTLSAAFGQLGRSVVLADCDVDAADLYLVIEPISHRRKPERFYGGYTFLVDRQWCSACGRCVEVCRFDAVRLVQAAPDRPDWRVAEIDPLACEGCGCCADVCPTEAIGMQDRLSGMIFISNTRFGPMVHGRLGIAESNSGKMVTAIRKYAEELARSDQREFVVIDGAAGIGCPVIASLAGIDTAVIVAEPSLSGLHDLERVVELCEHFKIPAAVIVNKFDLNTEITEQLVRLASERGVEVLGTLPFDRAFVQAAGAGRTILEHCPHSKHADQIRQFWDRIAYRGPRRAE